MCKPTYEELMARVAQLERELAGARGDPAPVLGDPGDQTEAHSIWNNDVGLAQAIVSSSICTSVVRATDGRFVEANEAFARLIGYPRAQIIGRTAVELGLWADIAQRQAMLDRVRAASGGAVKFRFRHATGEFRELLSVGAIIEFNDEPCVFGLHVDVTGHARAEAALRQSEEKFRSLFHNAGIGMFRTRADGSEILDMNDAFLAIFRRDRDEMLRHPSTIHWADPGEREEMLRRLRADGEVSSYACRMLTKAGDVRHCLTSVRLDREQGVLEGSILDVTEQRNAEAARLRLERQIQQGRRMEVMGQLAGGIAHDFNNILAGIVGLTDLCLHGASPNSTLQHNLQDIMVAAERAQQLIARILTFSRGAPEERRPVRLRALVEEVLALVRAGLTSAIEVRSEFGEFDPLVQVDPAQIHEVLLNLFTNAAHAMGKQGLLVVKLTEICVEQVLSGRLGMSPQGSYARIQVCDTGCGMTEEVGARMFEPFFTTKPPGEGTGLGLAVAYGAMRAHDGNIDVESVPGAGTTITLYLPLEHDQPGRSEEHAGGDPRGQERILVVDDEPLLARVVAESLNRLGYDTVYSVRAADALGVIKDDPAKFDLVVTDHTMPVMSGLQFARTVHQLRSDLPVILVSGYDTTMDSAAAEAAGIAVVLAKPFRATELARKVREVLDGADVREPGAFGA